MKTSQAEELDEMLTPRELAAYLKVRPGTVFSWLSRGVDLPPFVKIGGSTRWREKAVMNWITAKEKERRRRNFED